MNHKTKTHQAFYKTPEWREQGLGLAAATAEFPRLFHGEPPTIPGWVLPGWQPLVRRLLRSIDTALTEPEAQEFQVLQVKEKWGTLSFYFRSSERVRDQVDALVDKASQESATVCMRCAKPAKLGNNGGWMAVLCEEHQRPPSNSPPGDL